MSNNFLVIESGQSEEMEESLNIASMKKRHKRWTLKQAQEREKALLDRKKSMAIPTLSTSNNNNNAASCLTEEEMVFDDHIL